MASFLNCESIFELSGGREMITAVRATELLQLANQCDNPSVIRLSNKSFGQEAAEIVAERLRGFTGVKVADISDIIAGRHEDDALIVLMIICSAIVQNNTEGVLEEVNVSDNALGQKGVVACQSLLQVPSVKRLFFCNNGLSAEASELITKLLLASPAMVNDALPFTTLHFYNNMSGENGAKASAQLIEKCPQLTSVRYSATRAGREGCAAIAEALSKLTHLEHVDLADSSFSGDNTPAIVSALANQPKLSYLNIRDGGLETEGVEALATSLTESSPPLRYLDLSGNDASVESLGALGGLLEAVADTLEEFILDDSEINDVDAIKESLIPALAKLTNIHTISFCGCFLTASAAVAIAKCVSKIASFRVLKLDGNEISAEGVAMLLSIMLKNGKTLGSLEENDEDGENDLDEEEEEEEEDEEGNNAAMEELGAALSESNISS